MHRGGYPSTTTLLGTLMREHPLAVALAGLAAGAAVAAAFPATTLGRRVFRQAGQRRSEAVETAGEKITGATSAEDEKSAEEARAAKAILDAHTKAVADIRAGRPAPYYFTAADPTVSPPATSPLSNDEADTGKITSRVKKT
jgi:hypothetical protein